jgi:hypothetical protein
MILFAVRCQNQECTHKGDIVLPYSIPLRTALHQGSSATAFDFLNVGCHRCAHVYRYTYESIRQVTFDLGGPDQLPFGTVPLGMWLRCDKENCASHVLVESQVGRAATENDVEQFARRLTVARHVTCFSGHPPRYPLELLWDSISSRGKS